MTGRPPQEHALVELEDVSRSFVMGEVTVNALQNVSFAADAGEVTVILGPSGCGKTTLLNQIGGIDSPTGGRIWVDGRQIAGLGQKELTRYRQTTIGFIFQFFNLIPNLSAKENVEFVLEYVMNARTKKDLSKALEALEKVGLGPRADHYPYQLSGGEQQRVAIARALAKEPRVLLADEPTGELDYKTGLQIINLLVSFAKEGRAVLVVTHNRELARIADQVIRLRDGAIHEAYRNETPAPVGDLEW